MLNTMYQEKSGEYVKKLAELSLIGHIESKGSKKIGSVAIDLAEVISGVSRRYYPVTDCPDKKANVCVSVKASLVAGPSDSASEASVQSGYSEGEYSGSFFADSGEVGEETKKSTGKGSSSKPPRIRKRSGSEDFTDTQEGNLILIGLQKEVESLKTEKGQAGEEIKRITEEMRQVRGEYSQEIEKLRKELEGLRDSNGKLKERKKLDEESVKNVYLKIEQINDQFEQYKLRYNHEEKKKMKKDIKTLTAQNTEATGIIAHQRGEIEGLIQEHQKNISVIENLKAINEKLTSEFDRSREETQNTSESALDSSLPLNNSRKKTQDYLTKLKHELKEAQEEIEELRASKTDSILKIQELKNKYGTTEESLKDQIRKLESELVAKKAEITELSSKVEEELHNSKQFERKSLTAKEIAEAKAIKLGKDLEELVTEKEILNQKYSELQKQYDREKNIVHAGTVAKLEGTITLHQKEILKLKQTLIEKEKEIDELSSKFEIIDSENIRKRSSLEISESEKKALFEKISLLEKNICNQEDFFTQERIKLNEEIKDLENKLKVSEKKHKDSLKIFEEKIEEITSENISLRSQSQGRIIENKPGSFMNPEALEEELESMNRQLLGVQNSCSKLSEELKNSEQRYQECKLMLAKKELEKENLQVKYRETQDQIKEYSSQYGVLEAELYKINEKFGQALNNNNELENQLQDIKEQIHNAFYKNKKK